MLTPSISIVTPSLNQGSYLGEALRSVNLQEHPCCEHLVLDGGSNDHTTELLQAASSTVGNHPIVWRSHADQGQSAALNEGFARARGEIVGWLNADDRYRPDCFEYVARTFAENPEIDVLYGDYTFIDQAGRHMAVRREIEFNHFILKYHRVLYIPTAATFFRRRIFEEGHYLRTDLHYAMDLEFFLRLAEAGYRFQHLPRVLADFRVHPDSKSTRYIERQRAEHRAIVLSHTPLAQHLRSDCMRSIAASALQWPAAAMRWSEKLCRGFYWPAHIAAQFAEEEICGVDHL